MTKIFGFEIPLSPYILGPLVLVVWILLLDSVRALIYGYLQRLAKKTAMRADDIFLSALRLPLRLLIFVSGFYLAQNILPLSAKLELWLGYANLVLVIFAAAYFVNRILAASLHAYGDKHEVVRNSSGILNTVIKVIVFVIAGLIFLDSVGVSITPLLASLGIGSVAIALALQDTLNNLFSGVYLLLDRPIQVGDFIKLESGEEGFVEKVGWRSTRVRMLPNNIVIIPNSKVSGSTLTNYYLPEKEMSVLVQVGVHYDSDLEKVERVTIEVGREMQKKIEGAVREHEPFIRYHTFDSSSINFSVILRVHEFVANYLMKHEFIKALQKRYNEEGIIIPFPIRTLEMPAGMAVSLADSEKRSRPADTRSGRA